MNIRNDIANLNIDSNVGLTMIARRLQLILFSSGSVERKGDFFMIFIGTSRTIPYA